jgi:hypothetical protein
MGHSKTISTRATSSVWWARLDSNQRPTGYEPGALPLSYGPGCCAGSAANHAEYSTEHRGGQFDAATACMKAKRSLAPDAWKARPGVWAPQTWCRFIGGARAAPRWPAVCPLVAVVPHAPPPGHPASGG